MALPIAQPKGRSRLLGSLRFIIPLVIAFVAYCSILRQSVSHTALIIIPKRAIPANNAAKIYDLALAQYRNAPPRTLVARNTASLDLIVQGLDLEYAPPSGEYYTPSVYKYVKLIQLLNGASVERLREEDWNGTVNRLIDGIAFSESLLHGATVNSCGAALNFRMRFSAPVVGAISRLNATELQIALNRLDRIAITRPSMVAILETEKYTQLELRDNLMSSPRWREDLSRGSGNGQAVGLRQNYQYMTLDRRRVLTDYINYIDTCIQMARSSRGVVPTYPQVPGDPINLQLATDVSSTHKLLKSVQSQDGLLRLHIALRLHKLRHGAYPAQLSGLGSSQDHPISLNPNSADGSFSYRVMSNGQYLLEGQSAPGEPFDVRSAGWNHARRRQGSN